MRFNIYVGETKYFSTLSVAEAFDVFRRWFNRGLNVSMEFVNPSVPSHYAPLPRYRGLGIDRDGRR